VHLEANYAKHSSIFDLRARKRTTLYCTLTDICILAWGEHSVIQSTGTLGLGSALLASVNKRDYPVNAATQPYVTTSGTTALSNHNLVADVRREATPVASR
jgi:hypothetical protein